MPGSLSRRNPFAELDELRTRLDRHYDQMRERFDDLVALVGRARAAPGPYHVATERPQR